MDTITQDARQSDTGKINDSNSISEVAVGTLVPSSIITTGRPTPEATEQLSNANREPQPILPDMQAAFDKNSTRTVSSNIKKWLSWCTKRQLDPVVGSLNSIIEFFTDQLEVGKAMRGIYNKNPPPPTEDEVVDLVPAFDKVRSLGDNETMDLLWLLHKTAFLLAITTASRPSDLARIEATSKVLTSNGAIFMIRNPKEHKISLAHGGNKLATKKSYVSDYPDLPEISPLAAVNVLLSRTQVWRFTDEQKASLLLTSTGLHKPPSSDTVTR
ncbi:hypothetical protein C2G38_2198570 [Gigaspora rosea]|uniref:Tyr recombinase domain-containing protein n=1 Tax=Gigaspora rosea TaxID=44941 RepID=A0A397USG6_9GLOM|nr:hypothetical protein C2G38_2198570 [Gigaspora rosea]